MNKVQGSLGELAKTCFSYRAMIDPGMNLVLTHATRQAMFVHATDKFC